MKKFSLSPDEKYREIILDKTYDKDFIREIKKYRKRLQIPPTGLGGPEEVSKFVWKIEKDENCDLCNLDSKKIKHKYKKNPKKIEMLLAWKDCYNNGPIITSIAKKFNIAYRFIHELSYYITQDYLFLKNTWLMGDGYGCDLMPNVFSKKKEFLDLVGYELSKDVCAVIRIYPEAKKSDIEKLIDTNYDLLRSIQKKLAKKYNVNRKKIVKKNLRSLYKKILNLSEKGYTSREVAERLNLNQEGSWEYVRKVKSLCKSYGVKGKK